MLNEFTRWYEKNEKKALEDFFTFLRFKSVSTDHSFDDEVAKCCHWLEGYIKNIGYKTQILKTPAHPVIYAESIVDPSAETVLLYHHYDVQPPDPYELWDSDPFTPEIRNGEIFARGAQDNKGQCFYTLLALRAFHEFAKSKRINIKLCIEGDEEGGSSGLSEICKDYKDLFRADHLLVIDAGIPEKDQPAIILGIRGIATLELTVISSDTDLHSGEHGGLVYNPVRAIVEVLAKMRDEDGKIVIPNFYDDVKPISDDEKKSFSHPFDIEKYKKKFGIRTMGLDPGYSPVESNSMRPTLEINGIFGGYTGKGFKTVLPKEATVKISARLVPNQDPNKVTESIFNFFKKHLPKGMDLDFQSHGGGNAARSEKDSKIAKICERAYADVFGKPCQLQLIGGSIPVAAKLADVAGANSVFLGMGLNDDNIHAPNEHFGVDRLKTGFLVISKILMMLNDDE